jgi:hypothetical protein
MEGAEEEMAGGEGEACEKGEAGEKELRKERLARKGRLVNVSACKEGEG